MMHFLRNIPIRTKVTAMIALASTGVLAMRDRYQPGTSAQWTNTTPGDTGEMIEEMQR